MTKEYTYREMLVYRGLAPITLLAVYGTILSLLSEYVQNHPELYELIKTEFGVGVANMVLGHLGNVLTPVGMSGLAAGLGYVLFRALDAVSNTGTDGQDAKKRDAQRDIQILTLITIMISQLTGLLYILVEIVPQALNVAVGVATAHGRPSDYVAGGDVLDVIANTVPFIAIIIFYMWRKFNSTQVDEQLLQ